MRIAVVAHLRHPIAAPFMGGMEAHCHQLVGGLLRRGHDVTLFASGDSDPALPLIAIAPRHYDAILPWSRWHGTPALTAFQDQAFQSAWQRIMAGGYDVVHNNAMHPALHAWAQRDRQAMVTSLHVPPFDSLAQAIHGHDAPWLGQTLTSASHMASWWTKPRSAASVVYNGIDLDRWRYRSVGNGRAIWAGRITPTKGTHIAIVAAAAAGIDLDLVGPIDCTAYFEREVAPRLAPAAMYRGHLSGDALIDAIGAASVLIATPMWDEPFGLVAVEAMACGVPVAALDRGALSEVIGDCGALATDSTTLPSAIGRALAIPRDRCRARAVAVFSQAKMIAGYERVYAAAIDGARASSVASTVAELA